MKNFHSYCGNKLPPPIDLRAFDATANSSARERTAWGFHVNVARSWSRVVQFN